MQMSSTETKHDQGGAFINKSFIFIGTKAAPQGLAWAGVQLQTAGVYGYVFVPHAPPAGAGSYVFSSTPTHLKQPDVSLDDLKLCCV